jgi:hypothetical protein
VGKIAAVWQALLTTSPWLAGDVLRTTDSQCARSATCHPENQALWIWFWIYQTLINKKYKLLKKSQGIPLIFTRFCKSTLLLKQCKLECWNCTHARSWLQPWLWRLGVLHTQLWRVWESSEKRSWIEKCDHFLLLQHVCHSKFLTKRCTTSATLKPELSPLFTGNNNSQGLGAPRRTTQ